jgi:membrane protein CcdC involved in cytochrome C biogenesis
MLVLALLGGAVILVWRLRETMSPLSIRRIVGPPLGMATGFSMFAVRAARVPWTFAAGAFALGALVLAIPLARTSTLVRRGDLVLMQRSRAFLWILLGLVALRLLLRAYVGRLLTPVQTGSVFFILAFGMIARWRATMLLQYLRLRGSAAGALDPPGAPGAGT